MKCSKCGVPTFGNRCARCSGEYMPITPMPDIMPTFGYQYIKKDGSAEMSNPQIEMRTAELEAVLNNNPLQMTVEYEAILAAEREAHKAGNIMASFIRAGAAVSASHRKDEMVEFEVKLNGQYFQATAKAQSITKALLEISSEIEKSLSRQLDQLRNVKALHSIITEAMKGTPK